ncbi:MAG: hypothetical protein WA347_02500 [Rhabdochlamydiaceae bacterium]
MENLKIYIDRLKGTQTLKIEETLSPDFLEVDEEDLLFDEAILIKGEAYVADEHLVIHLNIETTACLPCSICNHPIQVPVALKNIYLTKTLTEIAGAIYDITDEVRESILIQTPLFAECNGGKCPEREHLKQFLKPEQTTGDDIVHFPFADLDKE